MNMWGMWFTFFVPAFVGGTALGAALMAFAYRSWIKNSRAAKRSKTTGATGAAIKAASKKERAAAHGYSRCA